MGKNSRGLDLKIKRRIFRAKTRQIVSKLPNYQNSVTTRRDLRKELKRKACFSVNKVNDKPEKPSILKVGSINVDGLDTETDSAIRDILYKRSLDVRFRNKIDYQ